MLIQLLDVVLESLEDADLHKLFKGKLIIGSVLQLDVSFFWQKKVGLCELLLVGVELLLE